MKSLIYILLIFFINPAIAREEIVLDRVQEKRAQDLFTIIKCPTCAGQSIKESNSEVATDLRIIIKEQIKQGRNDEEILADLRSIHGDQITFQPPFIPTTIFLWITPILILIISFWIAFKNINLRRSR
jgi:cytochrome c-type biogenesis protein CcmH/NrfF